MMIQVNTPYKARLGSGFRNFFVLNEGRIWITLLYIPTMTKIRFMIRTLNPPFKEISYNPKRLAATIRSTGAFRRSLNCSCSASGERVALAILKAEIKGAKNEKTAAA